MGTTFSFTSWSKWGTEGIRLDKPDGKTMEPLIRAGSMVAIDRGGREIRKKKPYAVRSDNTSI